MRARITGGQLRFTCLILFAVAFPLGYYCIDPSVLEITDRANYENVFLGNTLSDTAFYPVFLLISKYLAYILNNDYTAISMLFAIIFYASSLALLAWKLGNSFNNRFFANLILPALVAFSFYSIKTAFALKKLALGLTFVNLFLLSDNLLVSLVLRFSALLVHPQLLPVILLPSRLFLGHNPNPFQNNLNLLRLAMRYSSLRAITMTAMLISLLLVLLFDGLNEYGDVFYLVQDSLQLKIQAYVPGWLQTSSSVMVYALILAFGLFTLLYFLRGYTISVKFYAFSILTFATMTVAFGSSRLFLLLPYFLFPLRSISFFRLVILGFFAYSFYRTILAWTGALPFAGV
jgi:hypothetical protein